MNHELTVCEMRESDIDSIIAYWLNADKDYLQYMGADKNLLPSKVQFAANLSEQSTLPYSAKNAYCLMWHIDGKPVGHCNTNPTEFGNEAYMHLHLWHSNLRQKGLGLEFAKRSIPIFFTNLQLSKLYCQPYALNPAPNKLLEKLGFTFVKEHVTVPGSINFEQRVKLWEMNFDAHQNQLF